jgi:transcription initiation factor IIE alpha subunit
MESTILDRPLTWSQLINTDVCPRHHVSLLMQEYGNPDTAMVCPKCEDELEELRKAELYEEQLADVDPEPKYEPTDNEYYYSQEYIDGSR